MTVHFPILGETLEGGWNKLLEGMVDVIVELAQSTVIGQSQPAFKINRQN